MSEYLLGLVGHPLSHSLSPVLHKAALHHFGLKGDYRLFDIPPENLTVDLKNLLSSGVNGLNVTIPYKEVIYQEISEKTEEALLSKAVNTVKIENIEKDLRLFGHNTDIAGFKLAFNEAFDTDLKNKSALVIGAGGAARAIVIALAEMGLAKVSIRGRNQDKVNSFISEMQTSLAQAKKSIYHSLKIDGAHKNQLDEIAVTINASSIGLTNETPPEWLCQLINILPKDCICFDAVYRKDGSLPIFTQLATDRKLQSSDGLSMLINQARYAFEYWTGLNVPITIMRDALKNN